MPAIKRALISVSDKTGIVEFARELHQQGVEILSTGGTAELLKNNAIPVVFISDYTGFPEMMDGRIKTLHPKIHGGILGRRDVDSHREAMATHGIRPIDLVVINLYPFEAAIARENCTLEEAIENIDIGGPAMIRSAAKNSNDVAVVVHPPDYDLVLQEMKANAGAVTLTTRRRLSRDAFAATARYDALISRYLSGTLDDPCLFPPVFQVPLEKIQELRYGENPHQSAAVYRESRSRPSDIVAARQIQGKELSFNNILDLHAAWDLVTGFDEGGAVIIKHNNPCGVALGADQKTAFVQARETDPISAFGGILGFNRKIEAGTAEEIVKNFAEAVVAPGFDPGALEIFASKKNLRVMDMPELPLGKADQEWDLKRVSGGMLVQNVDNASLEDAQLQVVSARQPTEEEMISLRFAWVVAKHVKSNAIVYARGKETVGIGAGQMSRVDSAKLAIDKAQKPVQGSVMASDAFFPFRDAIDAAAKTGITAIIQPGGSIRDQEIIDAANEKMIAMVFTGVRHFKH